MMYYVTYIVWPLCLKKNKVKENLYDNLFYEAFLTY